MIYGSWFHTQVAQKNPSTIGYSKDLEEVIVPLYFECLSEQIGLLSPSYTQRKEEQDLPLILACRSTPALDSS